MTPSVSTTRVWLSATGAYWAGGSWVACTCAMAARCWPSSWLPAASAWVRSVSMPTSTPAKVAGSPTLAWGPEAAAAVWQGPLSIVGSYKGLAQPCDDCGDVARADIAASAGVRRPDRRHPDEVALDQPQR